MMQAFSAWAHRGLRRHNATTIVAVLALALLPSGAGAKKPYMNPPPVSTFDGKTWAGITMGRTTQRDIKDQVRTGNSDYHNALQMSQPKGAGLHVEVLCLGKDMPVGEIVLRYDGDGAPEQTLVATLPKDRLVRCYESGRMEDWWLDVWPERGVVAFVHAGNIPWVALTSPDRARALAHQMSMERTPVVPRVDPHAGEPKVATFGDTTVTFSLTRIRMDEAAERRSLERRMQRATADGTLRYSPGASGYYSVSISGSYDGKRGGSIQISCSIHGTGPYGAVSGSGSQVQSLPKDPYRDNARNTLDSVNFEFAVIKAMQQAENDFSLEMALKGPPPLSTYRLASWQRAIEALRTDPQQPG